MHTSIRSETPRLINIRSNSNGSVQVDREISVVSARAKSPVLGAATYSTIPTISAGHMRAQSNHGSLHSVTALQQVENWNSQHRMADRFSGLQPRPSYTRQNSQDRYLLESNRESMKALSDFLMTREPPAHNWVSVPSDDETNLTSIKNSARKIFGRQKRRKSRGPRLLQLPDSAVAAKTSGGARHIAISIPIEHDHLDLERHVSARRETRSQSSQRTTNDRQQGAVTVLKPVVESSESISYRLLPGPYARDINHSSRSEPSLTPATGVLGPEATKTMENYYTQLGHHPKTVRAGESGSQLEAPRRSYVAVAPTDILRQDSQKADLRHSGGTAYSTMTLTTIPGHSRGASSVSTAPSASYKPDFPPRISSMVKTPLAYRAELAGSSHLTSEQAQEEPIPSPPSFNKSGKASIKSTSTASQSPPTVFATGTAKIAQSFIPGRSDSPQLVRTLTPKLAGSAPTKALPNLPGRQGNTITRPLTAPPARVNAVAATDISSKRSSSLKDNSAQSMIVARQSRQERVKARKQRDMAALRGLSDSEALPATDRDIPQQTASLRSAKRRSFSQDLASRKAANRLSPIMLVANLAPFTGIVLSSDLPSPSAKIISQKRQSSTSNTARSKVTHTPPRSIASSNSSDSDNVPKSRTRSHISGSNRSLRSTVLETRRQERRTKRNLSLHEKEVEERLSKVERDNMLLLNTLSGIASSFGELHRLLPRAQVGMRKQSPLIEGSRSNSVSGDGSVRDLAAQERQEIEPIMRELQGLAGRISGESLGKGMRDR